MRIPYRNSSNWDLISLEAINHPETVGFLLSGAFPKNSPVLPTPDAHAMATRTLPAFAPHPTHPSPVGPAPPDWTHRSQKVNLNIC